MNISADIEPTETYYIPKQWKLSKDFAELCGFEIATLIGWYYKLLLSPVFGYSPWYNGICIKSGLAKIGFHPSYRGAIPNPIRSLESL